MPEFLKAIATLLAGNMAGSNNKASFVVHGLRFAYISTGGVIAVAWYSGWRNERVAPGSFKFPFPGVGKLTAQFPINREDGKLAEAPEGPRHKEFGTSIDTGITKNFTTGRGIEENGGYVYPFTSGATVGRIDQGQDFGGVGPIFAIGKARIIQTGAPGWPGGAGVVYQLLNGSRRGQFIFVFEGISVTVRKGDIVPAGHVIGQFIPGSSTGIEIGFCDALGVPLSHAEYTEGKETVHGKEMKAFLEALKRKTKNG